MDSKYSTTSLSLHRDRGHLSSEGSSDAFKAENPTGSPPYSSINIARRGKWARFSGTDEELAKIALEHAKFQAAKRRPLLQQISHSMSRRNGFNSQEEFDTVDEQWVWSPNNSQDNLQFQAVNCSICGNYICVSTIEFPLPDCIRCNCDHFDNDLEEFVEYEYEEEKKEENV